MLYSKKAIGILSLLLSPLLGTILFAHNLKEIGQAKLGPAFVIGSIFLGGMTMRIAPDLNPWIRLVIINIVESSLLYFYFWDKFFGEYEFKRKNFWPPTLFFAFVISVVIVAQYFYSRR
jgi:uncharacterized membrane protein